MRNADNIRLTPPPQERGRLVRAKPCPELAGGPPALRSLPIPVQWHDRAWRPRLVVRLRKPDWRVSVLDGQNGRDNRICVRPFHAACGVGVPPSPHSGCKHVPRGTEPFFKPMKTIMIKRDEWQVTGDGSMSARSRTPFASPVTLSPVTPVAFTIVELLTVIAIIAILAAMLLPALSAAKIHAQKTQAQLQIQDIVTAIQNYDSAYSRFPVSSHGAERGVSNGGSFTYGDQWCGQCHVPTC